MDHKEKNPFMSVKIDTVFLLKAIKEKEIIDIHFEKQNRIFDRASRFLKLSQVEKSIIIQCPSIRGVYFRVLEPGEPVSITFQTSGFRFTIKSKVISNEEDYSLPRGTPEPAIKIAWPSSIIHRNRRSLFRIALRLDETIKIKFELMNSDPEKRKISRMDRGIEAIMMDISETGIAVRSKPDADIKVGDILKMKFQLEENSDSIEVEGQVRNYRKSKDSRAVFYGIEFIKKNKESFHENLKKIALFMMSRNEENVDFYTQNRLESNNYLVQKIADNEVDDEVIEMLLSGKFSLSEMENMEALVFVCSQKRFRIRAKNRLDIIPEAIKQEYMKRETANHSVAHFIMLEALKKNKTGIIQTVVDNLCFPVQFLLKIARQGSPPMLESLIMNKKRLIAYPEIMKVMEKNPKITENLRLEIQRLRSQIRLEATFTDEVLNNRTAKLSPKAPVPAPESHIKGHEENKNSEWIKNVLKSLKMINEMTIPSRIRLAFAANPTERMILCRDTNAMVLSALLENPDLGDHDILMILKNKHVSEDAMLRISMNEKWLKNGSILAALVKNQSLPLQRGLTILNKLSPEELGKLMANENLNKKLRKFADNIFHQKI
jgi:hypothetical protein